MFTLFISVSSLLTLASETFAVNPPNKFAFAELYYTKELLLNVLLIRSTICCSLTFLLNILRWDVILVIVKMQVGFPLIS